MLRRALGGAVAFAFALVAACTDYGDEPAVAPSPDAGPTEAGNNMTDAFVSPIVDGGEDATPIDPAGPPFLDETFESNRPLEATWVIRRDPTVLTPTFQVSSKQAHSGTYSFEIESDGAQGAGYAYLEKSFGNLPLPLHFQYWIYFDAIPPGPGDHMSGMISNQLGLIDKTLELDWALNGAPGVEPYIYTGGNGTTVFPLHEWIHVTGEVTAKDWSATFEGSAKTTAHLDFAGTPIALQFGFGIGSGGGHWHFFYDDITIEQGPLPSK